MKRRVTFILFLSIFFTNFLCSQEINAVFGKNRVQYSDDFDSWTRYETNNFIIYWYGKSKNTAISAMQLAEYHYEDIQDIMEHRLNDKIEMIVYGNVGELHQTNIGLRTEKPETVNTVELLGNKMYVYFDGNHQNLEKLIRKGTAEVFLFSMLYGNSFTDMVQNTVMSDIPEWFKAGIIAYVTEKWNVEADSKMRHYIKHEKRNITKFKKLVKKDPVLAGQAFWYFLGEKYGKSAISNILYLARINRSIPTAFQYVLGEYYEDVMTDCMNYYFVRYTQDNKGIESFSKSLAIKKAQKDQLYSKFSASDDGVYLAYASNHNGDLSVRLLNRKTGKTKKIKNIGYNNPLRPRATEYPILFWSDDNQLGLIFEARDKHNIWIIDPETKETIKNTLNPIFVSVYNADFIDEEHLILSANTEGRSNLYTYDLVSRIESEVWDDEYDDLDVQYVENEDQKGYLFSSNRPSTEIEESTVDSILAVETLDLFFYNENDQKLTRITNTPNSNERFPSYKDQSITYLTDQFGTKSIIQKDIKPYWRLQRDNAQHISYSENIINFECFDQECYFGITKDKKSFLAIDTFRQGLPQTTQFYNEKFEKSGIGPVANDFEDEEDIDDVGGVPEGWFFQSQFGDPIKPKENTNSDGSTNQENSNIKKYDPQLATASRLRFKVVDVNTNLNNDPLFTGLRTYTGTDQPFNRIPLGLLFKAEVTDLFEDYYLTGGIRIATNFSGYEAFAVYEDRKDQWDHTYGLYWKQDIRRRSDQLSVTEKFQNNTLIGNYQIKYPFNEFFSIRLGATLRNDKYFTKIIDQQTYEENPSVNAQRIGGKIEFVFDNSSFRSINIWRGIRSKVFVEGMNRFAIQLNNPFTFEFSNGAMTVVGLDTRYALPIFQKSMLAFRLTGGTSLGSERILYLMGDVEGTLIQRYDNTTPVVGDNFAYQILTPQMRGFITNIRNGSSYALGNIELRVPIFRHLFSDQIKYDFIREFQVVGFFDSGTAWYGKSPYSQENPINQAFIENPVVKLDLNYYKDPLIIGYGFGVRTNVFGYFIKIDYAWGIATRTILEPRFHLSLGTDF